MRIFTLRKFKIVATYVRPILRYFYLWILRVYVFRIILFVVFIWSSRDNLIILPILPTIMSHLSSCCSNSIFNIVKMVYTFQKSAPKRKGCMSKKKRCHILYGWIALLSMSINDSLSKGSWRDSTWTLLLILKPLNGKLPLPALSYNTAKKKNCPNCNAYVAHFG